MKKRILIIKNIAHEGAGILQNLLERKNIPHEIISLDQRQIFPKLEEYMALIILGGPDSANNENKKISILIKRINEAIELRLPYLGICLGMQLLVKAQGGKVLKAPVKEIGFLDPFGKNYTVKLTDLGKKDTLFKGLLSPINVFHLHKETVKLTENMHLLGTGDFCKNQIVKINNNAYGIQAHFELTSTMFQAWLKKDPVLKKMTKSNLRKNFFLIKDSYTYNGKKLFHNFLRIAGF